MLIASSIQYVLGESRPITEIPELAREPKHARFLEERGFRSYRLSHLEPWELAAAATRRTLDVAGLRPDHISRIVYASQSTTAESGAGEAVGRFAKLTDLVTQPIVGVCLGECANGLLALDVAASYIEAGRAENVLLLTTDVAQRASDRLPLRGSGVGGDGAAACILSSQRFGEKPSFELLARAEAAHHLARAGLSPSPTKSFWELCVAVQRCIKSVCADLPRPVDKWLVNNLNHEVAGAMGSVLGITREEMYLENLPKNAHVFAADQFINLVDWATNSNAQSGSIAVGIGTGQSVCATAAWRVL